MMLWVTSQAGGDELTVWSLPREDPCSYHPWLSMYDISLSRETLLMVYATSWSSSRATLDVKSTLITVQERRHRNLPFQCVPSLVDEIIQHRYGDDEVDNHGGNEQGSYEPVPLERLHGWRYQKPGWEDNTSHPVSDGYAHAENANITVGVRKCSPDAQREETLIRIRSQRDETEVLTRTCVISVMNPPTSVMPPRIGNLNSFLGWPKSVIVEW